MPGGELGKSILVVVGKVYEPVGCATPSIVGCTPPNIDPSKSSALFLASCAVKLDSVDELFKSVALIVLPLAKLVYALSASLVLRSQNTTAP